MSMCPLYIRPRRLGPNAVGLVVLLSAVGATAQPTRTPTNPLDPATTAAPPTATPAPAPVPAPSPDAPRTTPITRPGLDVASVGVEPPPIAELLPEGLEQSGGWSQAQVVQRASTSSLPVAQADAGRAAAEAAATAAELGFLPNVTLGARYTRLSDITPGTIPLFDTPGCLQDIPTCQANPDAFVQQAVLQEPILDQFSLTASIGYNLTDLVGSKRLDLEAANADADAARAQRDATVLDVAQLAVRSYWDVVRARAQQQLTTESSAVAESRVREARDRLAQGVATDLEVLEAVGVERAYARLERIAGARVLLAETNLRHLLGLGRDEPLVLAAQLDDSLPESPAATAALIRRAQSSSPDLAAARARVEAAEARAASRESKLYPSLTASFNVNYDNPNPRIFPQEERFIATWDATVALRWSLDATIIGVAQRDQLDHLANQQRLALAQLENRVDEQVIAAAGDVDAALLGVEKARFDAGAARRRIEQRRQLHASGMATLTELADAENAWLSARLALVDALAEARVAAAALHRATGSSQPPPLEPRR